MNPELEDLDPEELQRFLRIMRPLPPEDRRGKIAELRLSGEIDGGLLRALEEYFHDDSSPELVPGSLFGKYTITDLLGEGGMGRVYQAWDPDLMRNVAIKLIQPDLVDLENEFREQGKRSPKQLFDEETTALASLRHAGIVSIYERGFAEDGTGNDLPYCAMELVNGAPLDRYCQERRLRVDDCIEVVRQVCDAVGYAHSRRVVHRDLKPSNILVDNRGQPRVLDFGLALVLDKCSPVDLLSLGMGSPGYLAPEQLSHEFGKVGYATDVYALGVILYVLLGKRLPCSANPSDPSFRKSVTREVPARLGAIDPECAGEIEEIVATCLEKFADDRYPNAYALQSVLTSCLEQRRLDNLARKLGVGAAPGSQKPPSQRQTPASPPVPRPSSEAPTVFHDPSVPAAAPAPATSPVSMQRDFPPAPTPTSIVSPDPPTTFPTAPRSADPNRSSRILVSVVAGSVCLLGVALIVPGILQQLGGGSGITEEGIRGIQSALDRGADLFGQSRYEEALEAFDEVLEEDPDHEIALLNRGRAFQALGETERARSDFERLLREDPELELVKNLLAMLDSTAPGASNGAQATSTAPVSSPSESPTTTTPSGTLEERYQAGLANFRSSEFRSAVETLSQVTAESPHYKEADINMAMAHFYLGETEEALAKFGDVIDANPDASNAYNLRGQCHHMLGNPSEAVKDFDNLIRLVPDYVEGYNRRGQSHLMLKNYDKALDDFERVTELQADSSIGYEFIGRTRIEMGDYENAVRSLDVAARKNPNDADIFYFRSIAYEKLGNDRDREKDLERALELNPGVRQQHE